MSCVPKVQEIVSEIFGKSPSEGVNPDEAVATGVAVQGGILRGVIVLSSVSLVFLLAADNQTQVGIKVLQGERHMAAGDKILGDFDLVGIPAAPRGMPQIEVTFDIDANGIVTVSAKDKATRKEQQITIRSSGGLSEDEIDKMLKEAELHAQKDEERRTLIDLRNSFDTSIYNIEKSLNKYRDKIPTEIALEIESAVADLRKAMAWDNVDEIKDWRIHE
ncbi:hypothetical protein V6N11_014488 [Hibiscus sabdariffa]|uniref:Heat shock protein 70 n=1 Tax=Hibiscus sabdariffa TaxID=183260 RepID=A0ABR2TP83_9ROSI